eukprot:c24798_g1_i1 orf=154-1605(+)
MACHIMLLPWTGQGHIIPTVQLAQILASQEGFLTTLVLSGRSHARLEAAASPLLQQPNIKVQVIKDGLNPDPSHIPSFQEQTSAIPTLQQSLEDLLQDLMASPHPVTCLISGTFCSWTQAIAQKFNIPRAELWTSPAYIYCAGFYHHCLYPAGLFPLKGRREDTTITCIPGLPPIKASDFVKEFLPTEEEAQANAERVEWINKHVKEAYGNARDQFRILVNSIYELDSQALNTLCADGVSAYAIGPLFLQDASRNHSEQPFKQQRTSVHKEDYTCLQWLDGKENASTLYIAFGTESKMTKDEVQELAFGLEASGQTFLWVIRSGSVIDESSMDSVLPEGFQERVIERGLIVSWAPQIDVLAHPSIGGFMSHCGWNSTLETLWQGVPILAWPMRADQGINKKFIVEDWKVGIAVEKHEGKVTRYSIEKDIRALMQEEEGARMREKVKEVKEVLCKAIQEGGSTRRNLDQFIHDLRCLSDKKEVV